MVVHTALGDEIRRKRLAAGLTQGLLAKKLGVNRATVIRWEYGLSRPTPSNILALLTLKLLERDRIGELLTVDESGASIHSVYEISIVVPRSLLNEGCRFGLLLVRIGAAPTIRGRRALLRPIDFSLRGDRGEMQARVSVPSRNGFEFKCFVDFGKLNFSSVKHELEAAGFKEITVGEGKLARAWFLLRDYRVVVEPRTRIRNNVYFPE
jgi:transcriptional regulator with XRE-family HTH domain